MCFIYNVDVVGQNKKTIKGQKKTYYKNIRV